MKAVHTNGWRVGGVSLALVAIILGGCAKRPTPNTEKPLPDGFYIHDATARESAASIDFRVALVGSYGKAVAVYVNAYGGCPSDVALKDRGADCADVHDANVDPNMGNFERIQRFRLTFPVGETEKIVSVKLHNNQYYEHKKLMRVDLSSAGEFDASDPVEGWDKAYGTIINDDDAPTLHIGWEGDVGTGFTCGDEKTCEAGEIGQPRSIKRINIQVAGQSQLPIKVPISTSGTATLWADYILFDGGIAGEAKLSGKLVEPVLTISPYGSSTTALVEIVDDGEDEGNETFDIGVDNAILKAMNGGDVTVSEVRVANPITVTILANDAPQYKKRPIAPMQVRACVELDATQQKNIVKNACSSDGGASNDFPGQDALASTVAQSYTAYTNTKIKVKSTDLDPTTTTHTDSALFTIRNSVACVYDEKTGLTWEAKNHLTWANGDRSRNNLPHSVHADDLVFYGGSLARSPNSDATVQCAGSSSAKCYADYFVAEVNHEQLCGMTGWRMPTIEELRSLVLYDPVALPSQGGKWFYHDPIYFWWLSIGTSAVGFWDYLSVETLGGATHLGMSFYPEVGASVVNQKLLSHDANRVMLVHD